uniref:FTH domain-containing protein n=1 Tax=Panagrellus redivivus TaxID=6233 RepID=A0A7E4W771_PANRE
MLKLHKYSIIRIYTVLTEPMLFSDLWPYIEHSKEINLSIKNLIYGKNVVNVIRKNQVCFTKLFFFHLDISQKVLLDLFDFILSFPSGPPRACFTFLQELPVSLAWTVIEKYESLGFKENMHFIPTSEYHSIRMIVLEGNKLEAHFC